jgi:hypothetical protein
MRLETQLQLYDRLSNFNNVDLATRLVDTTSIVVKRYPFSHYVLGRISGTSEEHTISRKYFNCNMDIIDSLFRGCFSLYTENNVLYNHTAIPWNTFFFRAYLFHNRYSYMLRSVDLLSERSKYDILGCRYSNDRIAYPFFVAASSDTVIDKNNYLSDCVYAKAPQRDAMAMDTMHNYYSSFYMKKDSFEYKLQRAKRFLFYKNKHKLYRYRRRKKDIFRKLPNFVSLLIRLFYVMQSRFSAFYTDESNLKVSDITYFNSLYKRFLLF